MAVMAAGECGEIIEGAIHKCFGETFGMPSLECLKKKRSARCLMQRNRNGFGKRMGKCFTKATRMLATCIRREKVNTRRNYRLAEQAFTNPNSTVSEGSEQEGEEEEDDINPDADEVVVEVEVDEGDEEDLEGDEGDEDDQSGDDEGVEEDQSGDEEDDVDELFSELGIDGLDEEEEEEDLGME